MVHNELQQNEKFLVDFKRSVGYLKVFSKKYFNLFLYDNSLLAFGRVGFAERRT